MLPMDNFRLVRPFKKSLTSGLGLNSVLSKLNDEQLKHRLVAGLVLRNHLYMLKPSTSPIVGLSSLGLTPASEDAG